MKLIRSAQINLTAKETGALANVSTVHDREMELRYV
jgi:hypothetical protein